ncbi:Exostosin, GT47 domain [Dillenia turbinata]|uniref:Exostosin, GT47 domain n=1 Tax=Dillenia turbinata TaxID=194707 RepID=A0AAN8WB92_9MAGN
MGYNRLCGCWTSGSSSTKLVLIMIPLILVFGFVSVWRPPSLHWFSISQSSSSWLAISSLPPPPPFINTSNSFREETLYNNTEECIPLNVGKSFEENLPSSAPVVEEVAENPKPLPFNETQVIPSMKRLRRKYTRLMKLEAGLSKARNAILEAKNGNNSLDPDYVPQGPMYWNPRAFHRSYLEMEKKFKVYVYKEGEPPVFHNGPGQSIYSTEGNFIGMMEIDSQFRTDNPDKAHVFFLPFSVVMLVKFVYVPDSHDFGLIKKTVFDYVNVISNKYPYWNRTLGADHFMLSCHDWGPETSKAVPNLYKNSIRVLCNANTSEGFKPSKDVSLPEINLRGSGSGLLGGPSPSKRPILAFFAGGVHGPVRPLLLEHWENKDNDIQVHRYLPKGVSYDKMMRKSRFCLCPSGYEVASPRVVEALYTGCVPVLISDHYVPPFSDVLNWSSFSVEVPLKDIPRLKEILTSISSRQYIRLQRRGVQIRKHFEVHSPPQRYDFFHMILHSVWLRRLNVRIRDQ